MLFDKVKMPFIKGLSVGLFSLVVLSYQNCAKPLDDIGTVPSGGSYDIPSMDLPTISLTGDKTSCTGSCTLSLIQNTVSLNGSGKVFRVIKHNGSLSEDISCISADGVNTASVALDYASDPGLNNINAYLVTDCSAAIGISSASYNITINPAAAGATYAWQIDSFGACSATACGTSGTQTRSITCKRNDGATVADTYCPAPKPATSQACSASPCDGGTYTYTWVTGTYGACIDADCDTPGYRTRSVTCTRNDGVAVVDTYCTTTKPSSTISCMPLNCDPCSPYMNKIGDPMCP